jgi:hypothetical protein
MPNDTLELDQLQKNYKATVEEWIAAIKTEEALASVDHSVAEVDQWGEAHFREDEIRSKVKATKRQYESALREKFFGFRGENNAPISKIMRSTFPRGRGTRCPPLRARRK